jgi:hypothetical protein
VTLNGPPYVRFAPKATVCHQAANLSRMEWTGRAPAPTATELVWGFREHEERIAMTCKRDVAGVHTIGIDTGKNTLHMVGLDETGAIILREKVSRRPNCHTACERAAMPDWDRSRHGLTQYSP